MDGGVELLKSQIGIYFGDRQHSHNCQATAYGPAIHFLSLDTHRLQTFYRHRCLRLPPQRICGLLQGSVSYDCH
jgi:hypothetical protein